MPLAESFDESNLFIASSENSLSDFLKTDISNEKHIHCQYPLDHLNASLAIQLAKRDIKWIEYSNTSKLYPPDYKPNLVNAQCIPELNSLLDKQLLGSKHLFCKFDATDLGYFHRRKLEKLGTESVSFGNGKTIYPPFQ